MNANEALRIWAIRELDGRAEVNDNDIVTVEEKEFSDGYCETCYHDWEALAIVINGEVICEIHEEFSSIMEQVLEIIRKSDNPEEEEE